MTAHASDALSHAQFPARPRPLQPLFCVTKIVWRDRSVPCGLIAEKIRSIDDRMAAMSHRPGTEAAGRFHLRITCVNLARGGDNFSHQ
jgi:hypothetical protein